MRAALLFLTIFISACALHFGTTNNVNVTPETLADTMAASAFRDAGISPYEAR